ncbi:MAG TPA: right-handed parallel beta-helix repeat-containing protein [Kofleriaceae bacterium]
MRSFISLAVVVAAALAPGCSKRSEKFCLMNPADDRCDPTDGGDVPCDDQNPCTTGVCQNNVCVECTEADASECVDDKPVCNTATNRCEPCSQHNECDSRACLPTGACGTDSNVAYVSSTGATNGMCSFAMPCPTVLEGLARGRDYVKISGNIIEAVDLNNRNVTFLAEPNARLQPTTGADALTIRGSSMVTVYDLTISGGSSGGHGVVASNTSKTALHRVTVDGNQGGGVFVTGASLTISSSTISRNLGGGISATGVGVQYDITNSFIYKNGESTTTVFGGVTLGVPSGTPRFEFNTIVDNSAIGGKPAGLDCNGTALQAANNIIARNTPIQHATGQCQILTSIVQDTVTGLNFKNSELAPLNYELNAGSTAIDKPTTASEIAIDFEGDPRPAGAVDIGADEFTP